MHQPKPQLDKGRNEGHPWLALIKVPTEGSMDHV